MSGGHEEAVRWLASVVGSATVEPSSSLVGMTCFLSAGFRSGGPPLRF